MECKNCGIELTPGKRFCPGCGLPVVDATRVPAAEEEEVVVELRKRIMELNPFIVAFEEKREEEKRKKVKAKLKETEAEEEAFAEAEEEELEEIEKEEDDIFDSIDIIEIEKEESEERTLSLENLYPSDIYDFMHELDGSEIRMFGYLSFMRVEYDSIQISLEDDDNDLSCIIDLNETYTDRAGNLISPEELPAVLKSLKGSGIIFVKGRVDVEDDDPIIRVDSIENCLLSVKKLSS